MNPTRLLPSFVRAPIGGAVSIIESAAGRAFQIGDLVLGLITDRGENGSGPESPERAGAAATEAPPRPVRPAPPVQRTEAPTPPAASPRTAPAEPPLPPEAKTIDDEPELVAEFGGEGAEDDAGPEIRIDEPWDGYRNQNANEIKQKLASADAETLAAVELYESVNGARKSVLETAERRLAQLA